MADLDSEEVETWPLGLGLYGSKTQGLAEIVVLEPGRFHFPASYRGPAHNAQSWCRAGVQNWAHRAQPRENKTKAVDFGSVTGNETERQEFRVKFCENK